MKRYRVTIFIYGRTVTDHLEELIEEFDDEQKAMSFAQEAARLAHWRAGRDGSECTEWRFYPNHRVHEVLLEVVS